MCRWGIEFASMDTEAHVLLGVDSSGGGRVPGVYAHLPSDVWCVCCLSCVLLCAGRSLDSISRAVLLFWEEFQEHRDSPGQHIRQVVSRPCRLHPLGKAIVEAVCLGAPLVCMCPMLVVRVCVCVCECLFFSPCRSVLVVLEALHSSAACPCACLARKP